MKKLNILMTGAGAPGASGILKSYKNNKERDVWILGVDVKKLVPTISFLDRFETVPSAASDNFISTVLEIAKKNRIDVIQPLVTRELELFSRNISLFNDNGIRVCVSPIENLQIANDKGLLLDSLRSNHIEIPEYYKVQNFEEFVDACSRLHYPAEIVCFKPTKANGSRGFRIIDSKVDKVKILFEMKPNNVYMTYEEACEILRANNFPELLVMEYLPGEEYSVDMLLEHGKTIYAIPRIRNIMTGGISTDCSVIEEKDVIDYSVSVAEKLNLHGNIGIQVKRDINGKVKILEINPRVQGSIVCCSAAGINLPYFGIKLALDEEIPILPIKWGTRMIRSWNETYYDNDGRPYSY